jgi:two-component system sensor kinase FixL
MIKEAAELALLGIREKGVRLKFDDGPADVSILADKIQIQQVLLNLLRNAAEAVADREHRDIALRAEARDGGVQISVIDNGPGLPDEVQAKLFQPFVSTKKTGMGSDYRSAARSSPPITETCGPNPTRTGEPFSL